MNQTTIYVGGRKNINPDEVIRLQADVNYTQIFFSDGKKICVATTLKEIESRFLPFPRFFRINKSLIINLDCIGQINDQQIVLQNGETLTPSRRRRKAFFQIINQ